MQKLCTYITIPTGLKDAGEAIKHGRKAKTAISPAVTIYLLAIWPVRR